MRRKRKRKVRVRSIGYAVCVLALGGIGFAVSQSTFTFPFRVRELTVRGAKSVNALDIRSLSGIDVGDPLFGKTMERALARLQSVPRVAKASLSRSASGKVTIQITEKRVAALAQVGELYTVDESGNLMEPLRDQTSSEWSKPVITGPWKGPELSEEELSEIRQGAELIKILEEAGVKEDTISEFHYDEEVGWSMVLVGYRARFVFGWEDFSEKARRLTKIMKDFQAKLRIVREIDLDFRDRAVVKLFASTLG